MSDDSAEPPTPKRTVRYFVMDNGVKAMRVNDFNERYMTETECDKTQRAHNFLQRHLKPWIQTLDEGVIQAFSYHPRWSQWRLVHTVRDILWAAAHGCAVSTVLSR